VFRKSALAALTITAAIALSTAPSFAASAFTVAATVNTIATVNLATTAYTFTSNDNTNADLPANENASIPAGGNITGFIRTTKAGTGIISIASPAGPLTGSGGATIPIASLEASCAAGTSNTGVNAVPTGLSAGAQLIPSASIQCAMYNQGGTGSSLAVGLLLSLFLDDTSIIADTYAALSGFSITASAT
jgi:hypothetical protein